MTLPWSEFIHRSIAGDPDDPFVVSLRHKLAAGHRVMHVTLANEETPGLVYVVILERLKQLSEVRIPHTASFTRWSLEGGIQLRSQAEETRRFAALTGERFEPLLAEVGTDYFECVLHERLRLLAPPRTLAVLAARHTNPAAAGKTHDRATAAIDEVLAALARDLSRALGYDEIRAGEILDGALARWLGSAELDLRRASGAP